MASKSVLDLAHFRPSHPDSQFHKHILALLTLLSFLTRFVGLSHPSVVVFDEVHILTFTSYYQSGEFFSDVHPPLGRLLYVALAHILGWQGGEPVPERVGTSYLNTNIPYVELRASQAFFSALTVPLVYQLMWQCGCGLPACTLAASLLLFDTAHIAHTRLMYTDGWLCFIIVSSLLCYVKFTKQSPWTKRWFSWLTLIGFCLSCAISTKYVGAFTYFTIGVYTTVELWNVVSKSERNPKTTSWLLVKHVLIRTFALIIVPLALYLAWFWVHLRLLPKSGLYDDWMSDNFQRTLEDSIPALMEGPQELSFLKKWLELQAVVFRQNAESGEGNPHPEASRPLSWPFSNHGVSFWCSNQGRRQIFYMMNVPGRWIGTASVIVFLVLLLSSVGNRVFRTRFLSTSQQHHLRKVSSFFFVTWITHYVPFFFMSRQLMLHSYLPASIASSMLAGSLLEVFDIGRKELIKTAPKIQKEKIPESSDLSPAGNSTRKEEGSPRGTSMSAWIICWSCIGLVVAFWWYWIPLTYGQPGLSLDAVHHREMATGVELRLRRGDSLSSCYD